MSRLLLTCLSAFITCICLAQDGSEVRFHTIGSRDGLTSNHITNIIKDTSGYLWLGTSLGLNRFDGRDIKVFRHNMSGETGLKDNHVQSLFLGPDRELWVNTTKGVSIYNDRLERFEDVSSKWEKAFGTVLDHIEELLKDAQGNYWLLHAERGLFKYDASKQSSSYVQISGLVQLSGITLVQGGKEIAVIDVQGKAILFPIDSPFLARQLNGHALAKKARYKLFVDEEGDSWFYAKDMPVGVYYKPRNSRHLRHYYNGHPQISLNNDLISNLTQDIQGRIWFASDHGGINILDKKSKKIIYLMHDSNTEHSLAQNSTTALYKDNDGIIWVGTYKGGVSYYHPEMLLFNQVNAAYGLPFEDVNRFVEDEKGNLFIGTNGGGLVYYDRQAKSYQSYTNDWKDPHSLGSNTIVSLLRDSKGRIWIGTYHGGINLYLPESRAFRRYGPWESQHGPYVNDENIWELYEDSKGNIWAGTLSKGLSRYSEESDSFEPINNLHIPSYISAIFEDSSGYLWLGTSEGIVVLDSLCEVKYRFMTSSEEGRLSNDYITDIIQDSKNRIWVATQDGLNKFDEKRGVFSSYGIKDGLPDEVILTLQEDNEGQLWASTTKGLVRIAHGDNRFFVRSFGIEDGLQSMLFNENAVLKTKKGELLFGGPSGFNIIEPRKLRLPNHKPVPSVVAISLFNQVLEIGEKHQGKIVLTESPMQTKELKLNYNQNVFGVKFSTFDFLKKQKGQFLYKLEGFNEHWLPDGGLRTASFTNLDPGEYTLWVKVPTNDGQWSVPHRLLHVHISPPIWKTKWAYMAYVLLVTTLLLYIRYIERKRQQTKYAWQKERDEAKARMELELMKTRFFTNVSHDFRTPLSLIMSPVDTLLNADPAPHQETHLLMIKRNANRLLNLVNQLLDFKKIDHGQLTLHLSRGDIIVQLRENLFAFSDIAEHKGLRLVATFSHESFLTDYDGDKLERMVFNLLGNALKYTPRDGQIEMKVDVVSYQQGTTISIVVKDDGRGIPKDKQKRIFDRYVQLDAGDSEMGNGLGLAIVKEYVQLFSGEIAVESEEGKGSCFTLRFPLNSIEAIELDKEKFIKKVGKEIAVRPHAKAGKLLIVDDDLDMRTYLRSCLKEEYDIEEAEDAIKAWSKALSFHPDIILSDINMPGESGIALCNKIKKDDRTRHIPVILLTAITNEGMRLLGADTGISDYVTKPFNMSLLRSKIKSQIKQRQIYERTYKKQLSMLDKEERIISEDEKFLIKVNEFVESRLGYHHFSVMQLADALCMSRVALYKRMLAITGHTPSEFIRNSRLKKAAQLLAKSQMNIAEIAYEVGFNDPKQFSKYFKQVYKMPPSDYKQGQ